MHIWAKSPVHDVLVAVGISASPQSRRWSPSRQRSPARATISGAMSSGCRSSGSVAGVTATPSIRMSISAVLNPVSSSSKSCLDQKLHLGLQQAVVPSRELGDLVVGDHVGPLLRLGQSLDDASRNRCKTEVNCGQHAPMAAQNDAGFVDKDGSRKAKRLDAFLELEALLCGVGSGVGRPGLEVGRCPVDDFAHLRRAGLGLLMLSGLHRVLGGYSLGDVPTCGRWVWVAPKCSG